MNSHSEDDDDDDDEGSPPHYHQTVLASALCDHVTSCQQNSNYSGDCSLTSVVLTLTPVIYSALLWSFIIFITALIQTQTNTTQFLRPKLQSPHCWTWYSLNSYRTTNSTTVLPSWYRFRTVADQFSYLFNHLGVWQTLSVVITTTTTTDVCDEESVPKVQLSSWRGLVWRLMDCVSEGLPRGGGQTNYPLLPHPPVCLPPSLLLLPLVIYGFWLKLLLILVLFSVCNIC